MVADYLLNNCVTRKVVETGTVKLGFREMNSLVAIFNNRDHVIISHRTFQQFYSFTLRRVYKQTRFVN